MWARLTAAVRERNPRSSPEPTELKLNGVRYYAMVQGLFSGKLLPNEKERLNFSLIGTNIAAVLTNHELTKLIVVLY